MKKVFALWLLSFWFIAVAYGNGEKKVVCKDGYEWVNDYMKKNKGVEAIVKIRCTYRNNSLEGTCFMYPLQGVRDEWKTKTMPDEWYFSLDNELEKGFLEKVLEGNNTQALEQWFSESLKNLYKENCKEVEF